MNLNKFRKMAIAILLTVTCGLASADHDAVEGYEYGIVVDGVVIGRIAADQSFADRYADSLGGYATDDPNAQIGYIETESGFMLPPPEFDTVKTKIVNRIDGIADSIIYHGIEYEGVHIPITDATLRRIIGIKGDSINAKKIKLNQTTIMDYSPQQIEDIILLIETTVEEAEEIEIQLTEAVNLAITTEELDDIGVTITQITTDM